MVTQLGALRSYQLRFKRGTVQRFERLLSYSNASELVAITDRNGNTVTITREPLPGGLDRITRMAEPGGRVLTLSYDSQGRIGSVTDPINRVVRYTYDVGGHLTTDEYLTRTSPSGVRHFLTDALGSTIALTDPTATIQGQDAISQRVLGRRC